MSSRDREVPSQTSGARERRPSMLVHIQHMAWVVPLQTQSLFPNYHLCCTMTLLCEQLKQYTPSRHSTIETLVTSVLATKPLLDLRAEYLTEIPRIHFGVELELDG